MSEYAVRLQNQPVDVSEEFTKQENHFFVGSKVGEFDWRSATGKITWKGMALKQRVSYHQVTLPLEDYKVWQDAPPGEYKDAQDLPFSISFITPKTVRLRLSARPETTRNEPFSLMLDGEPGTDDSWEMNDAESTTTYESRFGTIIVTHEPWRLEFRDASGKFLTRTRHLSDAKGVINSLPIPFSFIRTASNLRRLFAATFALSPNERLFGCGESFTALNKRGQKIVMWTYDAYGAQTYRLLARSRRLDIETHVDWQERQVLLKARFPLAVRSHEATYETMYGVLRRPTHRNTSWDAARFEVSGHRFADLSETGYGVALLNDGKYGHSVHDNILEISLLRSPVYPDPLADRGEHRFTYSLFPHSKGWAEAGVVQEAFALNSPLCPTNVEPGTTNASGEEFTLVAGSGVPLALGSLKRAEDGRGLILRLYEPYGARGGCALRFVGEVRQAERVNLLEDTQSGEAVPRVEGDTVRFEVRPFEVVTLRVEL